MFFQLIKRRIQANKYQILMAVSALSICLAILHSYQIVQQAMANGYKAHAFLTDIIVGPQQSNNQLIQQGLLFDFKQPKPLPIKNIDLNDIKWISPIYLGESYKQYPVIGTTPSFLQQLKNSPYIQSDLFSQGQAPINTTDIICGFNVAQQLNLGLGEQISISHHGHNHTNTPFKLSGILAPCFNQIDNTIIISETAFKQLHPESETMPNYFWITPTKPFKTYAILRHLNKNPQLTAISPKLHKQTIVKSFKPIKELMKIVTASIIILVLLQWISFITQDLKSLELEYTILKRNGASNLFLFGQFLCQYGCLLILSCCIGVSLSTYLTKTYHDSIQNIITFPIQHHQLELLDYSILLSSGIAIIATSIVCWLGFLHIKQSTLRV